MLKFFVFNKQTKKRLFVFTVFIALAVILQRDSFGKYAQKILDLIQFYTNDDGLEDVQGNKAVITNKKNKVFLFVNVDCQDMDLERNKLILSYNWREFVENNTNLQVVCILKVLNPNDEGLNSLKQQVLNLNRSLEYMRKNTLKVYIEKDSTFRDKYSIPQGKSCISIFKDDIHTETHTMSSFYMHLYDIFTIMFLEKFHPTLGLILQEVNAKSLEVIPIKHL